MKKVTKKKPIYGEVEIGSKEVDVWVTSDGTEFTRSSQADIHEFLTAKVNKSYYYVEELEKAVVLDLSSKDDFKRCLTECIFDQNLEFDVDELVFPNRYVFYEIYDEELSEYYREDRFRTYVMTVDEYKKMLHEKIDDFQ